MRAAPLPEFVFAEGREAFIRKNRFDDPSEYDENVSLSAEVMTNVEVIIDTQEGMSHFPECCTEGEFTMIMSFYLPAWNPERLSRVSTFHLRSAKTRMCSRI